MKFRILLLLIYMLACVARTAAQEKRNIIFFTNSGRVVKTKDSAYFVRIVSEPDSGSKLYGINEYYMNGKPKFVGESSARDNLQLEGSCINFYPSGSRQSIATYSDGKIQGDIYCYYPNGKLYTITGPIDSLEFAMKLENRRIIKFCSDSLGKNLATNGSGYFINYSDDFKQVIEEGPIKGGLRDGNWKGSTWETDTLTFTETYNYGQLISGQSKDKSGKIYPYTNREEAARPANGLDAFMADLHKKIHYPEESGKNRVQGQVLIGFTVEEDGKLTDLKTIYSPDFYLGYAAIHGLERCRSPWLPAQYYGKPIKMQHTIPVNFALVSR